MFGGIRSIMIAVVLQSGVFSAFGCGTGKQVSSKDDRPSDNLAIMEELTTHIGEEILARYAHEIGPRVVLEADSSNPSSMVRGALTRLLLSQNKTVEIGRDISHPEATRLLVTGIQPSVEYGNIRKPGLFSATVVDRTVSVVFRTEIMNDNLVVASDKHEKSVTDTIREDLVEEVERSSEAFTKGTVPELNTIDRYVEPFVIIGATGAAIFLFFQVRS